jgi:hypothetical protein
MGIVTSSTKYGEHEMKIVKETRQVSVNTLVVDGKSFDLHPWSRYIAVDADGEVWEYEDEPEKYYPSIQAPSWYSHGRCYKITSFATVKEDWAKSLIKIGE